MFQEVLQSWTRKFLMGLKSSDLPPETYLGGGTAISLHLGHRHSVDLDFFVPIKFDEIQWQQNLEENFKFKLFQRAEGTLIGSVSRVKLSLLGYRYKLIKKTEKYQQVFIASLPDLAAMKLDTIISRGAKRDFIDVYYLAQKYGLQKLFEFYNQKYGNLRERKLMIKKGLIYFEEANEDEMPDMLVPADWKKIKDWFRAEVKRV